MTEKKIQHYALKKIYFKHRHKFPKPLSKINICKNNDDSLSVVFFDDENDVTSYFIIDDVIYTLFIDVLKNIKDSLDIGVMYVFNMPVINFNDKVYLDKEVLFKLRNQKNFSALDVGKYANINLSSIYVLERGEAFNPSLNVLVNYSLFFKTPIMGLFVNEYKKELLKITLNDFVIKGYIDSYKQKEIYDKETTL